MTNEKCKMSDEMTQSVFDTLVTIIRQPPSGSTDTQRLGLVVVRTLCRKDYEVCHQSQ
jgi:hypothetical protein